MSTSLLTRQIIRSTPTLFSRQKAIGLQIHSSTVTPRERGKAGIMAHLHGSYHWDIERITAIGLMPLLATTLSGGPSSAVDMALGVVLPLHVHMGFDSCITDYFNPTRASPLLYRLMKTALYGSTTMVLLGTYAFNSWDVGMTEFVARLWAQ